MASKSPRIKVRMVSEAGTGFYYTTVKNPRNTTDKLRLKKYDPKAPRDDDEGGEGGGRGKHVWFNEGKIK